MSLAAQIAVGATALKVLSTRAATRSLTITNWGAGTLFYNAVQHGAAATLTTGNGTQITGAQPNEFPLTPLGSGDPNGLDVYVISGSTTTASVQAVPL
jgi:hypothetical protein